MCFHSVGLTTGLIRLIAVGIVMLGCALPSLAQEQGTQPLPTPLPADIKRILDRNELIVAMPARDAPPFFFEKNGVLQGVDVELAQGIAHALKVGVRFHRGAASFNEVVDVVARGEADMAISKLSRTLARAKTVRFSEPYLSLRHALALNRLRFAEMAKGRDVATVVREFDGTIGVIAGTSYMDFAQINFPKAKIVQLPDWAAVIDALERGDVVAAYRDEFEVKSQLKHNLRLTLTVRTVTLTDTDDSLGIAVAANAHNLLGLVNLYLSQQPEKLTVERLMKRIEASRD